MHADVEAWVTTLAALSMWVGRDVAVSMSWVLWVWRRHVEGVEGCPRRLYVLGVYWWRARGRRGIEVVCNIVRGGMSWATLLSPGEAGERSPGGVVGCEEWAGGWGLSGPYVGSGGLRAV